MEATDLHPLQEAVKEAARRAEEYPENVRGFVQEMLINEALVLHDKRTSATVRGWKHQSYQQLVLTHGTVRMAPIHSDDILGVMEEKHCYSNAYQAVLDYGGYTYVEGYARTQYMALSHAWLEDEEGTIIDPTWANLDLPVGFRATYAGIKFTDEFVLKHAIRTGWHSIIAGDWQRRNEILQRGLKINDAGYAYDLGDLHE